MAVTILESVAVAVSTNDVVGIVVRASGERR